MSTVAHIENSPLARSLAAVEWPRVLQALEGRIATGYGKAAQQALHFLDDLAEIRLSLERVQEMRALIEEAGLLPFGGIHPIRDLLERAEKAGRLEVSELADVLSTQKRVVELGSALQKAGESPRLRELAAEVHREDDLIATLAAAITPNGELN